MKMAGCSVQYEEYSVREVPLRMKGGAVKVDISPEKEVMLCCVVSASMAFVDGAIGLVGIPSRTRTSSLLLLRAHLRLPEP
jgi:hypothetical protein